DYALLDEGRQAAVVVGVAMAQDQDVGAARIDLQHPVVVAQVLLGEGEIEEDLSPLRPTHRLDVVRETMLGKQCVAAGDEWRPLHGDGVELAALGEDIVDVVDDVGEGEPIHRGHGRGLRERGAPPAAYRSSEGERPTRDCAEHEEVAPVHGCLLDVWGLALASSRIASANSRGASCGRL